MRKERKIINTNIRLNLCDEQDRQAWEYLQTMDRKKYKSYSGRNTIIGNPCVFDQLSFDPIVGANIADLISGLLQGRDQSQIWGNMTGSAAAGEYNGFHKSLPPWIFHAH